MTLLAAFLAGVMAGLLIARFYPKPHDTEFREYLKREYGTKK